MYAPAETVDLSDVLVPWKEPALVPLSAGASALGWKHDTERTRYQGAGGRFDVMYSPYRRRWFAIDWDLGFKVYGELNDCINWCAAQPGSTL